MLKIHKNHTWGGGIGWGLIGGLVKIDITMFKMSLEHEISLEKTRHMSLLLLSSNSSNHPTQEGRFEVVGLTVGIAK